MVRVYIWIWGNLHRDARVGDSPFADLKDLDQIILFFWLTSKLSKWRSHLWRHKCQTVESLVVSKIKTWYSKFLTALVLPLLFCFPRVAASRQAPGASLCVAMFTTVSTLWNRKEFVKYSVFVVLLLKKIYIMQRPLQLPKTSPTLSRGT